MNQTSTDGHRRAALFVDFENVYLGLCASSREAGQRFATQPARWLQWMEDVLGPLLVDLDEQPRKVLRRICYLDPARSGRFRPYFTRAGFRVVDCPALTAMGKNSADIHMVLDILDTLAHPSHYDEFIVLSVDADFTPVLLRLREHDRRTAMLVSGPAAAAMQAACDFAIPDAMFLDEALGLGPESEAAANSADPTTPDTGTLRRNMEAVVRRTVAEAVEPVAMARVAQEVRKNVGGQVDSTNWAGSGGFGKFIAQITDDHLRVDSSRSPGWLYDPARHTGVTQGLPQVPEVAERVSRIVGVPLLSSEAYATLFRVLATDARSINGGGQTETERVARDSCGLLGHPVPRAAVHFVVLGFRHSGIDWANDELDANALAKAFADNILRLAADAQMALTEDEQGVIRTWIHAQNDNQVSVEAL
jgi:hypothetical protein